jgi:RNA polymerase sigma-70 factor, ECF subfamily
MGSPPNIDEASMSQTIEGDVAAAGAGRHPRPTAEGEAHAVVSTQERIGVEALFRAHAQFVATFLQRLGTPAPELDDLVQEVFLVAHRKGGYVRGPAQPRSWLGAIAVRIAQAGHRARRRSEAPNSPAVDSMSAAADAPERIDSRRSIERVQRALESLSIEQRAAFVLFEIEGESCESIAAVWDVPVGTVYSRLHHARSKFVHAYEALNRGSMSASAPTGKR